MMTHVAVRGGWLGGRSYDWKKKSHQDFVLINKQSKILHFDAQFFSIFPNLFVERLGIVVIPRDYTYITKIKIFLLQI